MWKINFLVAILLFVSAGIAQKQSEITSDDSISKDLINSSFRQEPFILLAQLSDSGAKDINFIEDSDQELLLEEPGAKTKPTANTTQNVIVERKEGDSKGILADSLANKSSSVNSIDSSKGVQEVNNPAVETKKRTGPLKPAKIEDAQSVNFSKNINEYRSPKVAMLLSFLVPGLGQAYIKQYYKTAAFGLAELGVIGGMIYFSRKGDLKVSEAQSQANQRFNEQRFFTFYNNLKVFLSDTTKKKNINDIFFDSLNTLKNILTNFQSLDPKSAQRKNVDDYLQLNEFVQGWIDCKPDFSDTGYVLVTDPEFVFKHPSPKDPTPWLITMYGSDGKTMIRSNIFGYSRYQNEYNATLSNSARYNAYSSQFMLGIVACHLISAIDAFISAHSQNNRILNKTSMLDHIEFDQRMRYANGEIQSQYLVRINF